MSDNEDASEGMFSFGTINETQILKVYDGLPYNPFSFDLGLQIIKTVPPFEDGLFFQIASGCRSAFGRKKTDVEHTLKAQTISGRHFLIDEQKKIVDLGSTKGTFLWVRHEKPIDLVERKRFLIADNEFEVSKVSYNQRKIWLKTKDTIIEINRSTNPFLFGSHSNCQYKVNCPQQYIAYINILTMKLHNYLEDQDIDQQKGVWQRLSQPKQQSQPRQLEAEDIIMAYPYIFKVQY